MMLNMETLAAKHQYVSVRMLPICPKNPIKNCKYKCCMSSLPSAHKTLCCQNLHPCFVGPWPQRTLKKINVSSCYFCKVNTDKMINKVFLNSPPSLLVWIHESGDSSSVCGCDDVTVTQTFKILTCDPSPWQLDQINNHPVTLSKCNKIHLWNKLYKQRKITPRGRWLVFKSFNWEY